jgi:hypothetical protein
MNLWITFWAWVIVGSMAAFAILAVVVTIGGWGDLKVMFSRSDGRLSGRQEVPEDENSS